jgi:hypothetical protein
MIKVFSIICAVSFFFNAFLHLLLIFGAPLGEYVLGGQYIVFPMEMRIFSVILFTVWFLIGWLYLIKGGILKRKYNNKIVTIILIFVTIFLINAIFWNWFISTSIKEKYLMTPLSLITSICSIFVLINNYKNLN